MKKALGFIAGLLLLNTGMAQELPQPSPFCKVEQRVGLTDITIEYCRPSARGRVVFGDLVPYGEIWRTGANASTKIEFSTDVVFGGRKVPAGRYALYTIPGKTEWTIILHRNLSHWGVGAYDESEDLLRLEVKRKTVPMTETFSMNFGNFRDEMADLTLQWEKAAVTVTINCNSVQQSKENIISKIDQIENAFNVYHKAARYYLDADLDPKQALMWAKKSTEIAERFWNVHTLALAYAANKEFNKAIEAAERSKALAIAADYQQYVKMNEDKINEWKRMN